MMTIPNDVDLIVMGSGAGGMTCALSAALQGLNVLLVEKTEQVGGTSARSAGSVWVPNSLHSQQNEDSYEQALEYLRGAVGNRLDQDRAAAFLHAAPAMVELLEDNTCVKFRAYPHHPDYLATVPGATLSGRVLEPLPFDGRVLGSHFANIRSPLPEFVLFGGMMVDRVDIGHLMGATRSLTSLRRTLQMLIRFGTDRLRYSRGTRLVMGNALVGRLYHALLQSNVPVLLSARVNSLVQSGGRVSGAVVTHNGKTVEISSRAGVVLATGGLSRHPTYRSSLMPASLGPLSAVVESAQGDGLTLAQQAGGHLGPQQDSNSFWAPVSHRRRADGSTAVFPHFVLDRGKPGALTVDPAGHRFVNEATTYHLFGEALFEALEAYPGQACFLVCDDKFISQYGLGMVRPKRVNLRAAVKQGYIIKAGTLSLLAEKLRISASTLVATIAKHNQFAASGIDEDFHKGEGAYQLNLGDQAHRPNPCIGALVTPPFYALQLHPGDIGASAGIAADASARVTGKDGEAITGLYTCGNDMASIMAGRYPAPGITLGPAMTFGFIAANHAVKEMT